MFSRYCSSAAAAMTVIHSETDFITCCMVLSLRNFDYPVSRIWAVLLTPLGMLIDVTHPSNRFHHGI